MERGIFRFILRYSARDQLVLVASSAAGLPFLYWSFDLPKIIVNRAIGGDGGFPQAILGFQVQQLPYLLLLCMAFLGLVLINGAFKYFTSTYRYRVGDRLLRRLRYDLIERLLRFRVADIRATSGGQVVSMITAETSNLGLFMAEAFAVPSVAIGTLGTIVLFMFLQNWMMGVAAVALYPLQIYLIPRIQRRINKMQREEALAVRAISDRIGELIAAAPEIHGHDTSQYELAAFSQRLGKVFTLRVQMSSGRYIVNVLNAFFSQLTPFFFLSIGGYLVITGRISLGSLVAVLAAYKDMYAPWKDLIDYYQKAEDARVKYDQLREFFASANLMPRDTISAEPGDTVAATRLVATNVVVEADKGVKSIDGASITLALPIHAAVIGGNGSGREEFARLLARHVAPASGRVSLGDADLHALPDSVAGRYIGYVGPEIYLGSGTLRDVLTYPLQRRPNAPSHSTDLDRRETEISGNSVFDPDAEWTDYAAAGCGGADELRLRMVELLRLVDMEQEAYELGLRRSFDPATRPKLAQRLIEARDCFRARVQASHLAGVIETFDRDAYLENATVAENILFGTPVGSVFAIEHLAQNSYMLKVIEGAGLTREFLERGRKLAAIMEDIFRDLEPGQFFDRFSFIRAEDLPAFAAILRRADANGLDQLAEDDKARLMALPFKLIPAQHNVGLIDKEFRQRILSARAAFARDLAPDQRGAVQFFDRETYNATSSVADNVLFGKLSTAKAGGVSRANEIMSEVISEQGLRAEITDLGLDFEVGFGAAKLNLAQRQKVALARCLLKRPDILVMNDALSALEPAAQATVLDRVRGEMAGRSVILLEPEAALGAKFDRVLTMDKGKIADEGARGAASLVERLPAASEKEGDVGLYELASILMRIPLFAGIDKPKLKLLAFASERLLYDAGQTVFRQGARGDKAYVILDGQAEVVLEAENARDPGTIVAVLGDYEVFGEMALLSAIPRTTTIRARTTLTLLAINQDVFLPLVEQNADIAVGMTRILAERLASTLRDYGRLASAERAKAS